MPVAITQTQQSNFNGVLDPGTRLGTRPMMAELICSVLQGTRRSS